MPLPHSKCKVYEDCPYNMTHGSILGSMDLNIFESQFNSICNDCLIFKKFHIRWKDIPRETMNKLVKRRIDEERERRRV